MVAAILFFLLLFTPLIFCMSSGHYVDGACAACASRPSRSALGRVLWKGKRWRTEWRLSAVHLRRLRQDGRRRESPRRPPRTRRTLGEVAVAKALIHRLRRSAVNLALPVLVFTWFLMSGHNVIAPIIGWINAGSAAAKAGIQTGDRILRIDDQKITGWSDLAGLIGPAAGRSLSMVVERNGQPVTLTVTPDTKTVEDPLGSRSAACSGSAALPKRRLLRPVQATTTQAFDRVTQVDGKPIRTLHEPSWRSPTPTRRS